jgi:hypothetical protein
MGWRFFQVRSDLDHAPPVACALTLKRSWGVMLYDMLKSMLLIK